MADPGEIQAVQEAPCWEDQAGEAQQKFSEVLGDRLFDAYKKKLPSICNLLLTGCCQCFDGDGLYENDSEMIVLKMKIGFALYGSPAANASENNGLLGYSADKMKMIDRIFAGICAEQSGDKILMLPIYVSLESNTGSLINIPVFRIPHPHTVDEFFFIDISGRMYKNWKDFLSNNKLPGSKCCYPTDGVYSRNLDKVDICYGITPAATLSHRVLEKLDTVFTVANVGAGIGAYFPPTAVPALITFGISSVYSAVRGSIELADRGNHSQSLTDREAARQWLSLGGSVLGMASFGAMTAVQSITAEGRVVTGLLNKTATGLTASSTAINGISFLENVWTTWEEGELASLQALQLVISAAFFAHSVVNFKTATSVIKETQTQILNDQSSSLSRRQRRVFDGITRETLKAESDIIVGRAKVIKDLNHISNKRDFFSKVLKSNKEARKNLQKTPKLSFGNLRDGPTSHGPTFLSRTVHGQVILKPTHCAAPETLSTSYVSSQEPKVVTALNNFIRVCVHAVDVPKLLSLLDPIFDQFPYGRHCKWAVQIIFDLLNCRNFNEALRILREITDFWQDLVEERERQQRNSSGPSTEQEPSPGQRDIEEIMSEIVEDIGFIPNHLATASEELVFHFPVDHRQWGENGELTPEDYILIAQNYFGIPNVECCNIMHVGDTANVYFEHFGLVSITSFVNQKKIVVKKFDRVSE